ncbi:MAG: hypothetical protein QXI60_06520 [Thermofilaceae archaeon]
MLVARAICSHEESRKWVERAVFLMDRENGHREYWGAVLKIPPEAVVSWSCMSDRVIGVVTLREPGPSFPRKARYKTWMTVHDRRCPCCLRALRKMGRADVVEILTSR